MVTVGIDEVGRGCLAGPLVAGAVALPADYTMVYGSTWRLADSKLLSRAQRQAADKGLASIMLGYGLGWVEATEIDQLGMTASVGLAMQRALAAISIAYDEIVIDGNYNYLPHEPRARTLVKADALVPAVSAASIIAKVARDNWMATVAHATYPQYGFDRHVGYGTMQHRAALTEYGITPLHRKSFAPVKYMLS